MPSLRSLTLDLNLAFKGQARVTIGFLKNKLNILKLQRLKAYESFALTDDVSRHYGLAMQCSTHNLYAGYLCTRATLEYIVYKSSMKMHEEILY